MTVWNASAPPITVGTSTYYLAPPYVLPTAASSDVKLRGSLLLESLEHYIENSLWVDGNTVECRLSAMERYMFQKTLDMFILSGLEVDCFGVWCKTIEEKVIHVARSMLNAQREAEDPCRIIAECYRQFKQCSSFLCRVGALLDASYTSKTPHKNTREICRNAYSLGLDREAHVFTRTVINRLCDHQRILVARIFRQQPLDFSRNEDLSQNVMCLYDLQKLDEKALRTVLTDAISAILDTYDAPDHLLAAMEYRNDDVKLSDLLYESITVMKDYFGTVYSCASGDVISMFQTILLERLFDETNGFWRKQKSVCVNINLGDGYQVNLTAETRFDFLMFINRKVFTAFASMTSDTVMNEAFARMYSALVLKSTAEMANKTVAVGSASDKVALCLRWYQVCNRVATISQKIVRDAFAQAFTRAPAAVYCKALVQHVKELWVREERDESKFEEVLPLFRALENKALMQVLFEAALLSVFLQFQIQFIGGVNALITLLRQECGDVYVANMSGIRKEWRNSLKHSAASGCGEISVSLVSSLTYNKNPPNGKAPVKNLQELFLNPGKWRVPDNIVSCAKAFKEYYANAEKRRLLSFVLGLSAVTILYYPDRLEDPQSDRSVEVKVSTEQYIALLCHKRGLLDAQDVEVALNLQIGGAKCVLDSLCPLVMPVEQAYRLNRTFQERVLDCRLASGIFVTGGTHECGTGPEGRSGHETFLAIGFEAWIMRYMKDVRSCDPKALFVAAREQCTTFASDIDERLLNEKVDKLLERDFLCKDEKGLLHYSQ